MKRKYNYFYKITNKVNGHFYYGIHSTDNLDDGYMGSGIRLHKAFEIYGIENFEKEIIKFFDNREDAARYEAEIVNENLVEDDTCYNVAQGGEIGNTLGTFTVYDKSANEWKRITYKEYNSNKENYITSPTVGKVVVERIDNPNIHLVISSDEYKNNKDIYRALSGNSSKGKLIVTMRDNPGEFIKISKEEYDKNIHISALEYYMDGKAPSTAFKKGQICVKDKQGNHFFVDIDDERYKSGELIAAYKGYKWTDEQKERLKKAIAGKQSGEKNSQFGTKWIHKDDKVKKVKRDEVETYLNLGWKLGIKEK